MAKEVNKRVNVFINGKEVENNIKSIRAAMAQLTNQLNKMTIGSKEYNDTSEKLKTLKKIYDDHVKSLKSTREEVENLSRSQKDNLLIAGAMGSAISGVTIALQKFISKTQQYIEAYATIDDAMAGVMKTTDMTREEVEALHESLKGIDTRTSTEELLTIAQIGGRMGLAKDQIEDFTRAVDLANVALGDSFSGGAEEISSVLGKISLAFKETRDANIGDSLTRIGSAINKVGGSANATEPNIAAFVQRVGSMPEAFRPSVQEAIALGAAFEESSIDAEVASRAFGILMNKASTDVEGFAKVMGKPVDAVRELINSNPTQFFTEFAKSLQGMDATQIGETLKGLKLNADGVVKIVGAMSGSYDRFNEILQVSNSAFAENTSLMNEFNNVNNNAAAQLEKAKKAVVDAKAALGEELMPVITKVTEVSAGGLRIAAEFTKFMLSHPKLLIGLAAAYTALYAVRNAQFIKDKAIAAFTATRTALLATHKTVVLAASVAYNTMTGATTRAAAAQKLLKAAFASTPWGAIITAVIAVGAALVSFIKNTNDATSAMKEFNSSVAKEQAEVDYLFTKLKNAEKGTDDYKEALQELIDKYPEVMAKHIDEKGRLDDINQAYQDIIQNIQTKIAMETKDNAIQDASAKALEEQREKLDKIRKKIIDQGKSEGETDLIIKDLKQILDSGDIQGAFKLLKDNKIDYNKTPIFGVSINNLITSYKVVSDELKKTTDDINASFDPFIQKTKTELEEMYDQLKQLQSAYYAAEDKEPYKNQIKELREKIRLKEEENKISQRESENTSTTTNGNSSPSTEDPIADFEKKLADFRKRQQNASLEGWAKTKQGIIDSYQEMIDEANRLGKEDVAEQLTGERDSAIAAAGEKYMNKMTNMLVEFVKQAETLKADGGEESELSRIIIGTNEEWEKKIETLKENITTVKNILSDLPEGDENRTVMESALKQMQSQLLNSASEQAKAVSNAIKEYTKSTDDFILAEQKEMDKANLTDLERQKLAIEEKYDLEIQKIQEVYDARAAKDANDPELANLEAQIKQLKEMKVRATGRARGNNIWENLLNIDWKNFKDNWKDNLQTMTGALQEFANAAFDIFNSINQIQTNQENAAFDEWCDIQDEKEDRLNQQLEDGVISQEYYNAQMEAMEKERAEKEKKLRHEQFERERIASLTQAIINGALSITMILAQMGPVLGAIPMALSAAMTAAQIAVIASQANPYARGGYINGEQLALMGEEGQEWVASNKLVKDKKTAPVIAALEAYQRGDQNAIDELTTVSEPAWGKVSQGSKKLSRTFASQSQAVTNVYNTNSNNTVADTSELLNELKQMNRFLSDPKNRQAYISRKTQLEFEKNENELKEMARL